MDYEEYRGVRDRLLARGRVTPEALAILDRAYARAAGSTSMVGKATRTMPMGNVPRPSAGSGTPPSKQATGSGWVRRTPAEYRILQFKMALASAVRRGFQKAGWLCAHCGHGVQDDDYARLCGGCADQIITGE